MTQAVAPIADLKVQRHCAFDTFVSRVDQRTKHSSGLAIHVSTATDIPPQRTLTRREPQKSTYYLQIERDIEEKRKGNQTLKRNQDAKKKAAGEITRRLRNYQKTRAKSVYKFSTYPEFEIDLPPDPKLIALFRVRWMVGPPPCDIFGPLDAK
jgi:hypothetical protein